MALLYYFRKQNAVGSYLGILPRKCDCTVLRNGESTGTTIQLKKKMPMTNTAEGWNQALGEIS